MGGVVVLGDAQDGSPLSVFGLVWLLLQTVFLVTIAGIYAMFSQIEICIQHEKKKQQKQENPGCRKGGT